VVWKRLLNSLVLYEDMEEKCNAVLLLSPSVGFICKVRNHLT
jgi:hypothetical protein